MNFAGVREKCRGTRRSPGNHNYLKRPPALEKIFRGSIEPDGTRPDETSLKRVVGRGVKGRFYGVGIRWTTSRRAEFLGDKDCVEFVAVSGGELLVGIGLSEFCGASGPNCLVRKESSCNCWILRLILVIVLGNYLLVVLLYLSPGSIVLGYS